MGLPEGSLKIRVTNVFSKAKQLELREAKKKLEEELIAILDEETT